MFRIRPKAIYALTPLHYQTYLEIRNTELQQWTETLFTAIKGRRLKFAAQPPAGHVMFNFGDSSVFVDGDIM